MYHSIQMIPPPTMVVDLLWPAQNSTSSSFLSEFRPGPSSPSSYSGAVHGYFRMAFTIFFMISIPFVFNYVFSVAQYHYAHRYGKKGDVPPEYPAVLPFLASTIPFLFDTRNFMAAAIKYAGKLTAVKINLSGNRIFFFAEPESLSAMWRSNHLTSPIYIYCVALQTIFGMPERALKAYLADNSGPYRKPHANSNVEPHNRVDHLTHELLNRAFMGPSLAPTFARFQDAVQKSLTSAEIGTEWKDYSDLTTFFLDHMAKSLMQCLFGPEFLRVNPHFIEDMWEFDAYVPKMAKRFPSMFLPKGYEVRDRLKAQIKNWYAHARANFDDSMVYADGDGDPYWGSELCRSRQKVLASFDGQCDDALASADLGLMWAGVVNVLPASLMATIHIFRDESLLSGIRSSLTDITSSTPETAPHTYHVEMEKLEKKDLLQSVYCETLRMYSQAYVTRCSPHADVSIGSWTLPKNEVSMVSTYNTHHNDEFWNTKGGQHPVDSFWAQRFLIDPKDPESGPLRTDRDIPFRKPIKDLKEDDEPRFSAQGLEGVFIPYGGGFGACPGRMFSKKLLMYTTSLFATQYDIDVLPEKIEIDSAKFGLGTQTPACTIPFRIRQRQN